jgi:hypothetical protein
VEFPEADSPDGQTGLLVLNLLLSHAVARLARDPPGHQLSQSSIDSRLEYSIPGPGLPLMILATAAFIMCITRPLCAGGKPTSMVRVPPDSPK